MYEFYGLLDKNTLFTSSQTIVNRFIQAVDANFINKRSVSEYAKILNLSEGHLNNIIKKETGKPAGYHIRERILHEAQRLLIYTDSSISEISYTLNFSNPSYFFRLFKSLTGTTPKKFRKNHLKEKTISTWLVWQRLRSNNHWEEAINKLFSFLFLMIKRYCGSTLIFDFFFSL